jgi:hypothetical protein
MWTDCRTVVAAPLPRERYDYIDNLNHGSQPAFQDAIRNRFGVAGRIIQLETNVLWLEVANRNAAGFKPSQPGSPQLNSGSTGPNSNEQHMDAVDFQEWVRFCEKTLHVPVIDHTGLTGNYDGDLKWQWRRGQSETNAFKQALRDQFGLDLVPAREKIAVLVIEPGSPPRSSTLAAATRPPPVRSGQLEVAKPARAGAGPATPEAAFQNFTETKPPPRQPTRSDYPKGAWTMAGHASPEAALETYFWAIKTADAAAFAASMTVGAWREFQQGLSDDHQTAGQFFKAAAGKLSDYRILEIKVIAADEVDVLMAMDGGANPRDDMTVRKVGAEWRVDESP